MKTFLGTLLVFLSGIEGALERGEFARSQRRAVENSLSYEGSKTRLTAA